MSMALTGDSEAEAIAAAVQHDYLSTRVLPDGSVACLGDLMFTRAIILGVSREGYGRRFCFEDRVLASKRFAELSSEDDVPDGYVAQR